MELYNIIAILITLSALFGYLNHRFIKLPITNERNLIITMTYIVVVSSILVQGLTMKYVLRPAPLSVQ